MQTVFTSLSTGLTGLDEVLHGVRPGDNIVWQVDSMDDYIPFVHPFCIQAAREKRPLIYFRFADHPQLMPEGVKAQLCAIDPRQGFESFISEIFTVIERFGRGACYVFDCLSELSVDWYSDRMLGNFFMLTCPYLYDFETATYFALLRHRHMPVAVSAIHTTAQVVIDVYRDKEQSLYIHPLKVYKRYSPSMYMMHAWKGEEFVPVTRSATISEVLSSVPQPWLSFTVQRQDVWTRTFSLAQQCVDALRQGKTPAEDPSVLTARLLRMAVTRDKRLLALAECYFDLEEILEIGRRMVGTGLIGGKSVGMLLARAILRKSDPRWGGLLEAHDSFYIGSDVFYTYLVRNGCWWMRRRMAASPDLDGAEEVRQRMLSGTFAEETREKFQGILEYFGQFPIIVRSSSLLEDAYGNAFSGKYDSVFCANQGTPAQRLDSFITAVRTVYAGAMKQEALAYRAHWGLLHHDEQMALLVQRVSGEKYGDLFFPHVAGVGFSYNPFSWSSDIDPHAGMLRLVFGLGTRAVDRCDDDYTRVVALNAPLKRPEAGLRDIRKYAQRRVDVLDLRQNRPVTEDFQSILDRAPRLPVEAFASTDEELAAYRRERGEAQGDPRILTFDPLLEREDFTGDMRDMLARLQAAYDHPVDVEFTANFLSGQEYRINLVQCRPFQAKGTIRSVAMPETIDAADVLFETRGPVIGTSTATRLDRIVYVVPATYSRLSERERYAVARLIGRITHLDIDGKRPAIGLIGPGRWGTTTPSLGVPVSFPEINTVSMLCELATMHEGLIPDVSLGTHFFNDLVEMDMLYIAVYPDREEYRINRELLDHCEGSLSRILPDARSWSEVVKVIEPGPDTQARSILLRADSVSQRGICYLGSE